MIFGLQIALVVLAGLLTAAILLQARGTGLGAAFGGEGNIYRTKRGVEKILFRFTVVGSVFFFALALTTFLWSR